MIRVKIANTNLPCENTKIDIWYNSNLCGGRPYGGGVNVFTNVFACFHSKPSKRFLLLEVTIARKVLPYDLRLDYTNLLT